MSESVHEIRCDTGGTRISEEAANVIRESLSLNGVELKFEAPFLPVTKPMVDALAWAWQYCAEHGGRMPLEAFVETFNEMAYKVWTAPVLRAKFVETVELWRSKRTEVRERLDSEALHSEACLYAIALAILRAWPKNWEPAKNAEDYFRTVPREQELSGFGPCILPPVHFKSWADYPPNELPSPTERSSIRTGVLRAMSAWASLNAMEFDEAYADFILFRLFHDFACSTIGVDSKLDLTQYQLLNTNVMLTRVMTRRIIDGIAKEAKLSFDQVYDYLCALRLRLEWLVANKEDTLRKAVATTPCDHKFEIEEKGENTMNSIFSNLFNGNLFGKVTEGICKMDMSGRTAVRTSKGYKAYDSDKKALVNCSSFCFDTGVNMFFIVPTNKPKAGDIILKDGAPRYVLDVTDDGIKALDYETDVVETILPERHVFLGNTYFYGKVVNLIGKMFKGCGKGGMLKNIMLMKMLGGDKSEGSSSDMMQMLLVSKLLKDGDSPFEDLFECFDDDEEEDKKPAKKK